MKLEEKCKTLSLETSRLQDRCPVVGKTLLPIRYHLLSLRHEKISLLSECESLRHRAAQWEEEEGRKAKTVECQSVPTKTFPNIDSQALLSMGVLQLRNLNMKQLINTGILHTKLWVKLLHRGQH